MNKLPIVLLFLVFTATTGAECIDTESSFLHRVCYDKDTQVLRLQLKSDFYIYCNVPKHVVNNLLQSPSKGSFYNRYVKGNYKC